MTPSLLQMLNGWVWLSSPENESFIARAKFIEQNAINCTVNCYCLFPLAVCYCAAIEFLLLQLLVCVRCCFPIFPEFVINTEALATSATSAGICRRRVDRQFDQFAATLRSFRFLLTQIDSLLGLSAIPSLMK